MRAARRTFTRLARRPAQSAVAVAALALGIGLTGAMAAIVQGSFLRGLPFDDADRIVHVARRPLLDGGVLSAEATAWREAAAAGDLAGVERVAAWIGVGGVWNGDGAPAERRNGAYANPELFAVTGAAVRPTLGRLFVPEDDLPGAEPVVLLSEALWREGYGSDPEVLGRSVRIFGQPATIVGVLPPGFQFPLRQEFWLPLGPLVAKMPDSRLPVQVVARLDAESTERSERERIARTLEGMADRVARSVGVVGEGGDDSDAIATTVSPFVAAYTQDVRGPLWLATGAALCVLLIACANVGNLLLARGLARSDELAVRAALGAGRRRIAGTLLGETAALASAGGFLGLGIAWAAVRLYRSDIFGAGLVPSFWADVRLDRASLLVVLAATGFTALAAGTLPALRAGRVAPARVLSRGNGRGSTGSRVVDGCPGDRPDRPLLRASGGHRPHAGERPRPRGPRLRRAPGAGLHRRRERRQRQRCRPRGASRLAPDLRRAGPAGGRASRRRCRGVRRSAADGPDAGPGCRCEGGSQERRRDPRGGGEPRLL